MKSADLRLCRSLLFLPASNARAVEKARGLAADMVILDLEDAVPDADKDKARGAAVAALGQGMGERLTAVRINPTGSDWFGADAIAVRDSIADFIVLPKCESAKEAADLTWLSRKPVIAMIETAQGVLSAPAIAQTVSGLIAGTNDLALSLHMPPGAGRAGMSHALQAIVLAGRAGGAAVFDGVHNRLDDAAGLEAECQEGRRFGFDGKTLIHPGQIETANRIFGPSAEEIAEAGRLIAAAQGGAERFEGRMIETLHVEQARMTLARAR